MGVILNIVVRSQYSHYMIFEQGDRKMAVSIRNVEKFVKDHPELCGGQEEVILAEAKKVSHDGVIVGGAVENFMGDLTQRFFQEVTTDLDHVQIGLTDLQNLS